MTERLYYTDSYLHRFTARIVDRSPDGLTVYLDRTAFYPSSGGQPFDTGSLSGVPVVDVVDEDDRIAHRLAAPAPPVAEVDATVDWSRRFDHMQQHSGQHLLSAVFEELHALKTVSFHLGADSATIDLEGIPVDARVLAAVERRANELIYENRPLHVAFEHAAEVQGLRKPSEREGTLRIVSIDGLDRSACGGTHVRATGEIGIILVRKTEKIRQTTRVEFLCGARAVRRAHADYDALAKAAQLFSTPLDEVPSAIAAQIESLRAAEKGRKRLELDLAAYQGKELYDTTAPGPDGFRRITRRLEKGSVDELRAVAQNFTGREKSVFLAALNDPPSVLLAVSADAGIDAGKAVKEAIIAAGGRGGGTPRIAQGSVPNSELLDAIMARLT
ncbi:MAG TPA: alanyl-tRNA editing protein [Verrucomicrobiae bacterium]|nr:alanyl-tRNA editing protein [Verrucomicrobiae bacterium]